MKECKADVPLRYTSFCSLFSTVAVLCVIILELTSQTAIIFCGTALVGANWSSRLKLSGGLGNWSRHCSCVVALRLVSRTAKFMGGMAVFAASRHFRNSGRWVDCVVGVSISYTIGCSEWIGLVPTFCRRTNLCKCVLGNASLIATRAGVVTLGTTSPNNYSKRRHRIQNVSMLVKSRTQPIYLLMFLVAGFLAVIPDRYIWTNSVNSFNSEVVVNSFNSEFVFNSFNSEVVFNSFNSEIVFNSFNSEVVFNSFNSDIVFNSFYSEVAFNSFNSEIIFNSFNSERQERQGQHDAQALARLL